MLGGKQHGVLLQTLGHNAKLLGDDIDRGRPLFRTQAIHCLELLLGVTQAGDLEDRGRKLREPPTYDRDGDCFPVLFLRIRIHQRRLPPWALRSGSIL